MNAIPIATHFPLTFPLNSLSYSFQILMGLEAFPVHCHWVLSKQFGLRMWWYSNSFSTKSIYYSQYFYENNRCDMHILWRRQWHLTPVLLPGKSHGWRSPGKLQFMGLLRVGHAWVTSLSLFTFMHWRRKWQLTPVFLPGESQGLESLVGCRLWGRTESDTTEAT